VNFQSPDASYEARSLLTFLSYVTLFFFFSRPGTGRDLSDPLSDRFSSASS